MAEPSEEILYGIPPLVAPLVSDRARATLAKVRRFVETEVRPAEAEFEAFLAKQTDRWAAVPPVVERLKESAKKQGLWNLFLPSNYAEGAGFTNLEYGLMAEQMGRAFLAAEAMNCNAPDTGNMELLARYANAEQKKEWLEPLLDGRIRSAFAMTEKGVASSDATNIRIAITRAGPGADAEYVINGTKWWISGAGDPRCKLLLVMGKTNDSGSPYTQQSVIIVPRDTPGVTVVRPMQVFGYDDAPHGHMEVKFDNVRVPASNIIGRDGMGFAIIQGRLGPGRIHHCMRSIGVAQEALQAMVSRAKTRETFGRPLAKHGRVQHFIARSRIEISAGRLLVLSAAARIDAVGPKAALEDIAAAKIEVPNITLAVIDRAMQVHGAEGLSQDQHLARMYAHVRTLRIADGPDEVHLLQYARRTVEKL